MLKPFLLGVSMSFAFSPAVAQLKFLKGGKGAPDAIQLERLEAESSDAVTSQQTETLRSVLDQTSRALAAFSGKEILTEPQLQAYGQSIVDRLAKQYKGAAPEPAIRVELVADPGAGASASFDNVIYVSADLFSLAENEDEIAFMLAHEVAHVLSQDFTDDGFLESKKNITDSAARAAIAGAALANTDFSTDGGQLTITEDEKSVSKAARSASLGYFVVAEIADTVIAPSWTKRQEKTADLVATDLMMRAGYNPTAAGGLLRRMVVLNQGFEARFDALTQSWVERTKKNVGALVTVDGFDISFNTEEAEKMFFRMGRELLMAGVFSMRDARRDATHESAEAREAAITDYLVKHYAPQLGGLVLASVSHKGQADKLFQRLESARTVRTALLVDDLQTALDSKDGLLSGSTSKDSFFRYTMYQLRYAQYLADNSVANRDKALLNLERAKGSSTATPQIFSALAIERINDGHYQEAIGVLGEAKERFAEEKPFWPVEIMALVRSSQSAQAYALNERCGADGGRRLRSMCKTAYETASDVELKKLANNDEMLEHEGDIAEKSNDFRPIDSLKSLIKSGGND